MYKRWKLHQMKLFCLLEKFIMYQLNVFGVREGSVTRWGYKTCFHRTKWLLVFFLLRLQIKTVLKRRLQSEKVVGNGNSVFLEQADEKSVQSPSVAETCNNAWFVSTQCGCNWLLTPAHVFSTLCLTSCISYSKNQWEGFVCFTS